MSQGTRAMQRVFPTHLMTIRLLADRTNGRAIGRLSVVCDLMYCG